MFSKSFLKYIIGYKEENKEKEEDIKEIDFRPVKVKEAAKVVIASIKDYL